MRMSSNPASAITSASPTFATVMPPAPCRTWRCASSGILCVLVWGRNRSACCRQYSDALRTLRSITGSATVLLAGIYLLVVGLSAKAVVIWGGGDVFLQVSLLILVSLVVLVALLQSDRIRMRMGRFVSRNFQRPLYDYRMVWRKFTEGATRS